MNDPLVEAVLADPRADAPRERFAVAIARSEPETASFVRAQLELARKRRACASRHPEVERAAWSCGVPDSRHTERGMSALLSLLAQSDRPKWAAAPGYGRGFVEACDVDGAWFSARGGELTHLAPILDLCVHRLPADAREFFDSPALIHLRSLRFEGPALTEAQVAALSESPYLGKLRVLDISHMQLQQSALEVLLQPSALPRLRYLRVVGNQFPDINPVAHQEGREFGVVPSAFAETLCEKHGVRAWLSGFCEDDAPLPEAFD